MNKVEKLIMEILTQDQSVWVKNKKSGNTYKISKNRYMHNRERYEKPSPQEIKSAKQSDQVKPKKSVTAKNSIQGMVSGLFSQDQKPKKVKKTKTRSQRSRVQKPPVSENFKVPKTEKQHLDKMLYNSKKWLENSDKSDSDKQRFATLENNLKLLISEDSSKQKKLKALTNLVEAGLIETNDYNPEKKGLKIYFSDSVVSIFDDKKTPGLLRYKSITSSAKPNQMTRDICLFAMANGIEIPIRGGGASKAQGQFNQRGTVAILDPSESKNASAKQQFDLLSQRVGVDRAKKVERCNKAAADKILEALGDNKLVRVEQVGNLGKKALADMGIDDKKDPTDIIVYYQDKKTGKEQMMKISMKIYKNVNAIVVKAAGISNGASYYLGNQAKELDDKLPQLIQKNNFKQKDISLEERARRFKNFQEEYILAYKTHMQNLVASEQGQQKLLKMWKQVHGCGTNTWTCVANVGKETVELRPPDYYCNPKMPFVVNYSGTKISVQFAQKGQKFLDIMVARSSDWGTPSLKFIARHRKIKNPNEIKAKKSRSKKISAQTKLHNKMVKQVFEILQQMAKK